MKISVPKELIDFAHCTNTLVNSLFWECQYMLQYKFFGLNDARDKQSAHKTEKREEGEGRVKIGRHRRETIMERKTTE